MVAGSSADQAAKGLAPVAEPLPYGGEEWPASASGAQVAAGELARAGRPAVLRFGNAWRRMGKRKLRLPTIVRSSFQCRNSDRQSVLSW